MGALPDPPKIPEILSGARFLKFWEFLKIFPRRGPAGCLYFCRKMAKNRDFPGGEKSGNFSPPGAPRPPPGENFQKFPKFQKSGSREDFGDFRGVWESITSSARRKNFPMPRFFRREKKIFGEKKIFSAEKKIFFPLLRKKIFFSPRGTLSARLPRRAYGTCGHSEMD